MPTPLPHTRTRRILTLIAALVATVAVLIATPAPAHGATTAPVYSGKGWKAFTQFNLYSINPDPYTVVFATTTARTKLTPYVKSVAAQITTITGVKVTVSTTLDTTPSTSCPARHRIVVHYKHRPTGAAGVSRALACNQASDKSTWGGHVLMDSEYWTVANWFSTNATVNEAYRKDGVAHEFTHIFGLDHPNTDLDKDGTVEPKECVKNTAGVKPVMCAPNRGYTTASVAGRYTAEFDAAGLRQMARNWYLRQA